MLFLSAEIEPCAARMEDMKSFVVTIADIEDVRPSSLHWKGKETLSQCSDSSFTTVTPLSSLRLSVSSLSLSEGEIVLPFT